MYCSYLRKPWPYALVGAILILASTYLLGVTAFEKEKQLSNIESKIADISNNIIRSEESSFAADLGWSLAYIQRTIVKLSFLQDPEVQKNWDQAHAGALYSSVLKSFFASGKGVSDEKEINQLKELRTKAINGDNDALTQLAEIGIKLTNKAAERRAQLVLERGELEGETERVKSEIINIRQIALIIQIIGLVLLLVKELPESIWSAKHVIFVA